MELQWFSFSLSCSTTYHGYLCFPPNHVFLNFTFISYYLSISFLCLFMCWIYFSNAVQNISKGIFKVIIIGPIAQASWLTPFPPLPPFLGWPGFGSSLLQWGPQPPKARSLGSCPALPSTLHTTANGVFLKQNLTVPLSYWQSLIGFN